jgi:hypothetical protein
MRLAAFLAFAPALLGCLEIDEDDDIPEGEDGVGDYDVVTTDDKADATSEIRTRIDGLTVWMDPVAYTFEWEGNTYWRIDGRASRNLERVFTFVSDDVFCTADLTGKRTFTITFGDDHEINTILSGMPLFITIDPVTGEEATAGLWIAPRTARWSGASSIYVKEAIDPVWVGGGLVYRGGARLNSSWGGAIVTVDAGTAPKKTTQGQNVILDWTFDGMKMTMAHEGTPLHVSATRDGTTVTRNAGIDVRTTKLGLTRGAAHEEWANECRPAVTACVQALPAGTTDLSRCGSYRDILACSPQ